MIPRLVLASAFLCVSMGLGQTTVVTNVPWTDPSIVYSGTWYSNNSPSNTGGSSGLTNAKGAQAVLSFNGTGIIWIGATDPGNGLAYVYLDGAMSTINCYSANTEYQQPLFTARGLASGPHTLSIGVPHIRGPNATGSWVWINGFTIENGAGITGGIAAGPGRVEQTNPALTYTGQWFANTAANLSGGSSALATDVGARVNVNFNGVGITWLAYRDEWSGIANVYVDGTLKTTVDTFLHPAQSQFPMYSINGLPAGTHTLTIEVTGTHSAVSSDSWVWVDAFDVTGVVGGAPAISAGGVVSAASYGPAASSPVAPGQIISIFGSSFLATGRADAGSLPLPTVLGNASVNACGRSIPLYSVFPGQINAQVPWECPATGSVQLTVTANGQTSAPQTVNLASRSPGVFTVSSSGGGDGAILHADNSLVSSASPARGGETVVVYCTGLGATTPSFPTGSASAGGNTTVNPVTASIGGKAASVTYSGMTAGLVGLYQVNVVVPAGLSGSQPIVVTSNGSVGSPAASQTGVTLSLVP